MISLIRITTSLVFLIFTNSNFHSAHARTGNERGTNSKSEATSRENERPKILDWVAFGSGCQSSKDKPNSNLQFKASISETLLTQWKIEKFQFDLGEKDKAISECALRVSVQPRADRRIASISVRTKLLANKNSETHLRAQLLLLYGEVMISRQKWDLKKDDFARNREEYFLLSSLGKTENSLPKGKCGAPQIIGLDFTFEGLRIAQKPESSPSNEKSWIKTDYDNTNQSATLEITFEKCI